MTSSPLYSLIETGCETIHTCNRTLLEGGADRFAFAGARALLEATEAQVIRVLDEALCNVPRVQSLVYACGSIALADHMCALGARPANLYDRDWPRLFMAADASRLTALFARGLRHQNGLNPILDMVRKRRPGFDAVLFEDIAPNVAIDTGTIGSILHPLKENDSQPGWIDALVQFLQIQALHHPRSFARAVGTYLVEHTDPRAAAMAHLAGVPLDVLQEEIQHRNASCAAFLTKISSAHGRMALRKTIPDTATLLRDNLAWHRFRETCGV